MGKLSGLSGKLKLLLEVLVTERDSQSRKEHRGQAWVVSWKWDILRFLHTKASHSGTWSGPSTPVEWSINISDIKMRFTVPIRLFCPLNLVEIQTGWCNTDTSGWCQKYGRGVRCDNIYDSLMCLDTELVCVQLKNSRLSNWRDKSVVLPKLSQLGILGGNT